MNKNISEAEKALKEKPLFATSAERFLILDELKTEYRDLPQPLRFAKIMTVLLERVSTPIEDYDLIAGRCVDRLLTDEEEERFQAFIKSPDNPERDTLLNSGHCSYSWDTAVELGLTGMIEKAKRQRKKYADNEDKKIFLTGMIEIYTAIQNYILRYADAAEGRGMATLAENLRISATRKPDTFVSALQLLWIITLIDCAYISQNPTLTVGRLDQILYPLYKEDISKGILTREGAIEYVTDYYCKHNLIMGRGEHQVGDSTNSTTFERICCFDAPQYLLLAGTDSEGRLAVNELTELFAECIQPSFKNPVVVVRYVKGMDKACPDLWRILTDRALKSSSMMFYNDNNVLDTYKRMGIPDEDARRYIHFGCNWPSPGDNAAWIQGGPSSYHYHSYIDDDERRLVNRPYMRASSDHSWPEDFVEIMRELSDKENVTIEDFYTLFFERMGDFLDRKLEHLSREVSIRKRRPSAVLTFTDCFSADSLDTAECFSASAKYHFEFQAFQMFGTVADCFIAVDSLVMREKKVTLKQLLNAVDNDFVGYEDILALCRNADKYGMDTPLSNEHAKRLSHTASRLAIEKTRPYLEKEGVMLVPCMQSDTWHLKLGETYGATPDGRRANTPFSQNSRPSNGACVNGITAMFNSMLNLPHDGLLSGALNLDVSPKDFEGEQGAMLFATLLATYFNAGGLHAQVSCADVNKLIDAQKNPELYRDLRVRVTGYSGIFVDICKRLQNDIIERFK